MNQVGSRVFCFPFHIGKGPTFGSTSHFGMLHTAAIFSFSLEQLLHTSYVPTGGLNLIALPCVARIPPTTDVGLQRGAPREGPSGSWRENYFAIPLLMPACTLGHELLR
jgi:hypothetical protein